MINTLFKKEGKINIYLYSEDRICVLANLYVEPKYRQNGHGTALLKEAIDKYRSDYKVILRVKKNTWMENWYKRFGFVYYCSDLEDNDYIWLKFN